MPIIAILNHEPTYIKTKLNGLGYDFEMWCAKTRKIGDPSVIYGFNSFFELSTAKISTPPVLFETPTVVSQIRLNAQVFYADAKVLADGLIYLLDLKINKLKKALATDWNPNDIDLIKFEKNRVVQYGITSTLAYLVNAFLVTLPTFVHEPFLVSLIHYANDRKSHEKFLKHNRLITKQNIEQFLALGEHLVELDPLLLLLVKGDKQSLAKLSKALIKKNPSYKKCIQRLRFYHKTWGKKSIENYIDNENNINKVLHPNSTTIKKLRE